MIFVNGTRALYVNSGCRKSISDKNLSLANKNLDLNKQISFKGIVIAKLHNNPLASCYLINLDFLLSHNAHVDKSIILPFFVLGTIGFLISVFFLHLKQ